LHESLIGSHGALFASSCVVDGRWVTKITDYGMNVVRKELMENDADSQIEEDENFERELPFNVS